MNLSEQIIAALRARNNAGETYDRMEKSTGVSGSYIHQLVNNRSDPLKLSLEKFFALFPSAQISLDGAAPSASAPAADMVPRSELLDLREKYADLRDQYQDLRDQLLAMKEHSAIPPVIRHIELAAPYHVSGSSRSKK